MIKWKNRHFIYFWVWTAIPQVLWVCVFNSNYIFLGTVLPSRPKTHCSTNVKQSHITINQWRVSLNGWIKPLWITFFSDWLLEEWPFKSWHLLVIVYLITFVSYKSGWNEERPEESAPSCMLQDSVRTFSGSYKNSLVGYVVLQSVKMTKNRVLKRVPEPMAKQVFIYFYHI